MRGKIHSGTYWGKGTLEKKLTVRVRENIREANHFIGFNFKKYGVFVAYGVGRGWVRQGDTVVRGSRVKKGSDLEKQLKSKGYSRKDIRDYVVERSSSGHKRMVVRGSRVKKGNDLKKQLKSKGYSRKDIRDYVVGGNGGEERKPVDWFDSVLLSHMEELASIAQEYYGDYSMEKMDEMVRRMTIEKDLHQVSKTTS